MTEPDTLSQLRSLMESLRATKTQHRVHPMFGGIAIHDEADTREVPINPGGPAVADAIEALIPTLLSNQERLERMEAALVDVRRVIEFGYQRIVDGRTVNPLKNGEKCDHGRLECEDCVGCYDVALLAALSPINQEGK